MRAIPKDISTHRSDSKLRPSGEGMRDHMIASTYAVFVMRGAKARQPVPAIPQSDSRRDRRFGSLRACARKKKSRARAARFVRSAARRTVSGLAGSRDRGSRRCHNLLPPRRHWIPQPRGLPRFSVSTGQAAASTRTLLHSWPKVSAWASEREEGAAGESGPTHLRAGR